MEDLGEIEKLTKVNLNNLSKCFYPKAEVTKAQVIKYYITLAPKILPIIRDRPLVLTRYPDGIKNSQLEKTGFFEKNAPAGMPKWVKTFSIYSSVSKRDVRYIVCNDLDTLIWLANIAALEIHMPFSTINKIGAPDLLFFDIDPEAPAILNDAAEVALKLKDTLNGIGFTPFIKTSGKKGLHIVVPIEPEHSFYKTRAFVHQVGVELSKNHDLVVSEFKDTKRPGKIFVDYLQNSPMRTMVIPYSLRPTLEATVSTPLDWSEVKKGINPSDYTINSVTKRQNNPWKDIFSKRFKLEI